MTVLTSSRPTAQAKIAIRIDRLAAGNFGGPGYRVYYAIVGKEIVLLLCGGDKRRQQADIERAHSYFDEYRKRSRTK